MGSPRFTQLGFDRKAVACRVLLSCLQPVENLDHLAVAAPQFQGPRFEIFTITPEYYGPVTECLKRIGRYGNRYANFLVSHFGSYDHPGTPSSLRVFQGDPRCGGASLTTDQSGDIGNEAFPFYIRRRCPDCCFLPDLDYIQIFWINRDGSPH